MILEIIDTKNNNTIGAVQVYENNESGEIELIDSYHIKTVKYERDDIFGTNDEKLSILINISEFKENCLIAAEVFHELKEKYTDEIPYKLLIDSICNKLKVKTESIPDRVYEILSIIEKEYL